MPAFFAGLMVAPVNWFCSTLLVHQPNGYREMGAYNAANQWFSMLLFIPTALATGIVPILSDTLGEKDLKRSKKVLNFMLKINAAIIIPCVLVLSLLAPYVMRIYGRDYKDAWPTLIVLLITSGIYALLTPVGEIIAAAGKMWLGFGTNVAWAVVLIVVDLLPRSLRFIRICFCADDCLFSPLHLEFCPCLHRDPTQSHLVSGSH